MTRTDPAATEAAIRLGAPLHWAVPKDRRPLYAQLHSVQGGCRARLLDEARIDELLNLYENSRTVARQLVADGATVSLISATVHGGIMERKPRWRPFPTTWAYVASRPGVAGAHGRLRPGLLVRRLPAPTRGWYWQVEVYAKDLKKEPPLLRALAASSVLTRNTLGPTSIAARSETVLCWNFYARLAP